jgi:hypothetical protein
MSRWDRRVPFTKKGQLSYVESWVKGVSWADVFTFTATMTLDCYERGRSRVQFVWRIKGRVKSDATGLPLGSGKTVQLSLSDSFACLTGNREGVTPSMINDRPAITGTFTFKKQGTSFLCVPVTP